MVCTLLLKYPELSCIFSLQGTPYEGYYGPMQGMQQMGAYRHNPTAAYSYGMYHPMQHQGRGH